MGIPSCLTRNHITLHCTVSRNHILDNSCKHMANMRFAVCCRRSVIEGVSRAFFTVFHTFFKNMVFFPELFYFFLSFYEIQIRIYFLVQSFFLLFLIKSRYNKKKPSSCKRTKAVSTRYTTCYNVRAHGRYMLPVTGERRYSLL